MNINKYLEEFPGLVHFIYVDRMSHRMIAPGLEFASQETLELTKKKVRKMNVKIIEINVILVVSYISKKYNCYVYILFRFGL